MKSISYDETLLVAGGFDGAYVIQAEPSASNHL